MNTTYQTEEIKSNLRQLETWKFNGESLEREFSFRNFQETFAFMTRIALVAEKMDHHPDWCGGYNTLTVRLRSHDVNGITERDFKLARQINSISL